MFREYEEEIWMEKEIDREIEKFLSGFSYKETSRVPLPFPEEIYAFYEDAS